MNRHLFSSSPLLNLVVVSLCLWMVIAPPLSAQELIAHWSFDSTDQETQYYDVTGNGHTAIGTSVSVIGGVIGNALNCNDKNFDIAIANSVKDFNCPNFTIEGLIYSYENMVNPGSAQNFRSIFEYILVGINSSITGGYNLVITDYGKLYMSMAPYNEGDWIKCESKETILPQTWYHIAATYNGSQIRLYINGIVAAQTAYSGGFTSSPIAARIGSQIRVSDTLGTTSQIIDRFNGKIDELKLFNYALSVDSIAAHFAGYDIPAPPKVIPKLLAHWSFDSSFYNSTFYDVTGNGFDATCSKTLALGQGVKGQALESNVSGYSFHVANSQAAFSAPAFSLEALVKLYAVQGANYIVLSNQSYPGDADGGYALEINEIGTIRLSMVVPGKGGWDLCEGTRVLKADTWYHLTATYDGSSMKVYLNGVLDGSVSRPGGYAASQKDASIGCQEDIGGVPRNWINGMIDELKVFNFALPADSIAAHFAAYDIPTPPVPTPKLLAHWSFDSTDQETQYYDVTGNGHTAIGTNVSIIDGVIGNALDCNDKTFNITIANSVNDFNCPNFTIEGLIYSYEDMVNPGSDENFRSIFEYILVGINSSISGGYNLMISDYGKLYFSAAPGRTGNWVKCETNATLLPRTWYHVAATYDGSQVRLFINGASAAQTAYSGGFTSSPIPARIGSEIRVSDTLATSSQIRDWFIGKIDELKLYNYALSTDSIAAHFAAYGLPQPPEVPSFEINLGMKTTYARAGDTVIMPVYIANYEDYSISSIQLGLKYDPDQLTLLSISKDSGLVRKWELFDWNGTAADSIPLAMAGTEIKLGYGEGELFRCVFVVAGSLYDGDTCKITLNDIDIDEKKNLIPITVQNGRVIISQESILYGDVTGNGEVNITDAQTLLRYVVGVIVPLPCCPNFTIAVADVSGNGSITSYDAALIFQYSLGLIPVFPVEAASSRPLAKRMASAMDKAIFTFKPVGSSEGEVVYDLVGTNLRGFHAGEFAIACNASGEILSKSTISTEVRGATFSSRFSTADNLIKVAVSSNDAIDNDGPVTILRIILPPMQQAIPEFTIKTALINEGAILTEFENSGLVGVQPAAVDRAPVRQSVRVVNNLLTIQTAGSGPATLTVWDLHGRKVACHTVTGSQSTFDISKYGRGAYIYRLHDGPKVTGGRFMLINR